MTWAGLGMNYGANVNNSDAYPTSQVAADLAYLKRYVTRLRIALPNYADETGSVANCRHAATDSIAAGFYTTYGVCGGGANSITTETWPAFSAKVQVEAAWAQANGISELQIGNEEESKIDGSMTAQDLRDNLRTLATACQAIFTRGPLSYSVAQGNPTNSAAWASEGDLGDIDLLGLNVYGGNPTATPDAKFYADTTFAAFGARAYISEFNCFHTWAPVVAALDEEAITREVAQRYKMLRDTGLTPIYFFNWRWPITDEFACQKVDGTLHLMWQSLVGGRRWLVNT